MIAKAIDNSAQTIYATFKMSTKTSLFICLHVLFNEIIHVPFGNASVSRDVLAVTMN